MYALLRGPQVIRVPVPGPVVQFDSSGWVRESMLISVAQVRDSLKLVNNALFKEINQTRQEVLQLSEITGTLRLQRDSLSTLYHNIALNDSTKEATIQDIYGDSLFAVTAQITVNEDSLSYKSNLTQLRPISINTTTTIKGNQVYFYVHSEDFQELNIESYTTIEEKKKTWYKWLGGGIAAGIITWELIR